MVDENEKEQVTGAAGEEASGDENDDEAVAFEFFRDVMETFLEALDESAWPFTLQEAVLRFAAVATQYNMYELVGDAREQKESSLQKLAETWVRDNVKVFLDYLTSEELLRATARALEEPPIKLDRKFRRSL